MRQQHNSSAVQLSTGGIFYTYLEVLVPGTHLVPLSHRLLSLVPSNLSHQQQCPKVDAAPPHHPRDMRLRRHLLMEGKKHLRKMCRYLLPPTNLDPPADTLVRRPGSVRLPLLMPPPTVILLGVKRGNSPVVPGGKTKRTVFERPSKVTRRPTIGTPSQSTFKPRVRPSASPRTKK